jgi:hypothetical protein
VRDIIQANGPSKERVLYLFTSHIQEIPIMDGCNTAEKLDPIS